jgi:ankyrin repeat protein
MYRLAHLERNNHISRKALLFCFAALASTFTLQAADTDGDKLYAALQAGNLSELKALLDHGISANAADSQLITPLMYAAIVGSADAMRIPD